MKDKYPFLVSFLMTLSLIFPLAIIGAPSWLFFVVSLLVFLPYIVRIPELILIIGYAYYVIKPILYIWALVVTIQGKQDFIAIVFYILFALQIFPMVKNLIGTIWILVLAFKHKNGQ